ncbi:MerR family transcriptional regulator [Monashia sp. NPDC004114]
MTDDHPSRDPAAPGVTDPGDAAGLLPPPADDSTVLLSWPVGTVADQVGVSTSTLRSWERRYGLGPTRRTGGGHRRYGPTDVLRVRLMARLTAQGVPARAAADAIAGMDDRAVVARLRAPATEMLGAVAGEASGPAAGPDRVGIAGRASAEGASAEGASAEGASAEGASAEGGPVDHASAQHRSAELGVVDAEAVASIVSAAAALDPLSLVHLYRAALRRLDFEHAWTDVLAPSLRRIGEQWAAGRLGVESEHLASDVLQAELRAVARAHRVDQAGPPVLLVSADDEQHHLPLLALEAELARLGVSAIHLGPRVPGRSVVETARRTRARAVFVWASMARDASEPFWDLLDDVAEPARVVVGGPGWPAGVEDRHRAADICRVADLSSAVAALLPKAE